MLCFRHLSLFLTLISRVKLATSVLVRKVYIEKLGDMVFVNHQLFFSCILKLFIAVRERQHVKYFTVKPLLLFSLA